MMTENGPLYSQNNIHKCKYYCWSLLST